MVLKRLFFIVLLSCGGLCYSQVGIGTVVPASDAVLELKSTDKGLLVPRLTTAQRDAIGSPSVGLLIFNLSSGCLEWYNGSVWFALCGV